LQGRSLFGRIGDKVSYVDNGTVYQLASDPQWGRVMIGQWGQWVRGFTNFGGPGGALGEAEGIEISARKRVYIADRNHARILVATFSPGAQGLINPQSWTGAFARPADVAWDGQSAPLVTDYLYVVDDSLNTVSYWNVTSGAPGQLVWSYGGAGSGVGQFQRPTGVCVGKGAASNGGTQFTSSFYVVDQGNARVVRLDRTQGPGWYGSVTIPGWQPMGCAVDYFGNVYVTDRANHRLYKFTPYLGLLDSYGSYGMGANNMNRLASPRSISVPCGLKMVNNQSVWYCEGRVVTAEQWSDSSGAVEHYLGMSGSIGQPTVSEPGAWVTYTATDNAYTDVDVWQDGVGIARTLVSGALWPAGQLGLSWDGRLSNGQIAPSGNYLFRVSLGSAYVCPSGATWCSKFLYSSLFYHTYCVPGGGGGGDPVAPLGVPLVATTAAVRHGDASLPPDRPDRPGPSRLPVQPPTCGGGGAAPAAASGASLSTPQAFAVRQLPAVALGLSEGLTRLGDATQVQPQLSAGSGRSSGERAALRAAVSENGVTSLQIDLSDPSPISVDIFDLSGRLMRQIHEGTQSPGSYVLHWEGSLTGGGRAPPGVYLAVVRAQGRRTVSRLVLTMALAR
jgi:flagellar hook assembly protein FlgD